MSTPRPAAVNTRGWLRGIRFSWFTVVMFGVIVLAVLVLAPTIRMYTQQQQQISKLQASNDEQKARIGKLDTQIKDWDDPDYIKAQARDRLLYVMPGETSYLIIDDLPPAPASAPKKVSTKVQQQGGDWSSTLLRSMLEQPDKSADH
ncbi:FtsB family cell division protein [Gryllotalpicola protaetiae]|uniref:Septum formation initiator family protein n=1 Tax=Gryllotalpicola protaetiae TaxID=2419771 RepID=A0A387BNQ0_9MICO|nr:septum formation initiator family protein [Gryllotalpicola protaetiae]AYG02626.1 septum formation initiator family protein [Gryllotalpicola protaetiae]